MRRQTVSKEDIIQKGLAVIETEGIEKCSVRRLAKEAGISVGTVYNHFDSIDAFIVEAFNTSWQGTYEKLEKIAAREASLYDRLEEIFRVTLEDVVSRNNLGSKLYQMYMGTGTGSVHFKSVYDKVYGLVDGMLARAASEEKREALARWIVVLLFNYAKTRRHLEAGDRILLKQLLEG